MDLGVSAKGGYTIVKGLLKDALGALIFEALNYKVYTLPITGVGFKNGLDPL